jgi:hypothetical protein
MAQLSQQGIFLRHSDGWVIVKLENKLSKSSKSNTKSGRALIELSVLKELSGLGI